MNALKNLLISLLLFGFSAQLFAAHPTITKVRRIGTDTIRLTFDQAVNSIDDYSGKNFHIKIYTGNDEDASSQYYVGGIDDLQIRKPSRVNPNKYGYANQWQWNEAAALAAMDADHVNRISFYAHFGLYSDYVNNAGEYVETYTGTDALKIYHKHNSAKINNTNVTRNEGASLSALTFDVSNTASSETITYGIAGTDSGLFDLNGTTLTFKTAPDYETPADNDGDNIYNLTLSVNNTLSTTTKAITITIDNIIEDTIAISDQTRAISKNSTNGTAVGAVLKTEGAPSAFSITGGNDNGAFAINNSGQITVADATIIHVYKGLVIDNSIQITVADSNKLDYETATTQNIQVTISKTDADDKTATITVNINDMENTAPDEPTLSNNTILENSSIGTIVGTISATDVDTDNTTLTYVLYGSDKDNFEIDGNQLKTKTSIVFGASYNIALASSDGERTSSAKSFAITVTENLAITSANTFNAPEGTSVTHTLSASDTNATFSLVENTSGFFSINGTTLTFNGTAADFESATKSYTVKVKATTGSDADENAEQTITVNIQDVNEAPTDITLDNTSIAENTTFVGSFNVVDDVLGTETFSLVASFGDNASFQLTGGVNHQLSFKTAPDYENDQHSYNIKIRATDNDNQTLDKTFTINITDIDDTAPKDITLTNSSISQNPPTGTLVGTLSATDVDTDNTTLTYTLTGNGFEIVNRNELKTTSFLSIGTYDITVTAKDSARSSSAKTFTITVVANPNPAEINNTNVTRNEGASLSALTFDVTNTPSTETLAYGIAGTDAGLFTLTGSTVTFRTAPDHENPADNGGNNIYNLTLSVNDTISTTTKAITITVQNFNENTITLSNQTRAINENSANGTNVGVVLTTIGFPTAFNITSGNDNGAFAINNSGQITVADATKLNYETAPSQNIQVTISKTDASDKTATITITINNVNEETIAISNQTRAINENSANGTNVGVVLTTGFPTTFSITSGNTNGAFAISNSGQISVANANEIDYETTTSYTLKVKISKADADDQEADITITINNTNENTIALNNQEMSVLKGSAINTTVGTVSLSSGSSTVSTWAIDGGADQDKYKIDNNGVIKVKTAIADTVATHTIIVKANGTDADEVSATITINVNQNLSITSANTFTANEGVASTTHMLVASDTTANFSLVENTSGLFSLSGTNNKTLTFNGTNTDFESTTKTYTVKVKASTGSAADENIEQTITVNLQDVDDTAPTALSFTGNTNLPESTSAGAELGTLSATDTDSTTLTYSVTPTATFEIDGNKLKLKTTVDYDTLNPKTLTASVSVSDGTRSISKDFVFTITNVDDTAPSQPSLSATTIADLAPANSVVATISATDVDTDNSSLTYTLAAGADNGAFTIDGNQLKINAAVVYGTKSSYNIAITASDGTRTSSAKAFTLSVTQDLAIISTVFNANENESKTFALTANLSGATFAINGGDDASKFSLSGNQLSFSGGDFETKADYKVIIQASKSGETTVNKTITVTVANINEAPSVNISGGGKTSIGKTVTLTANATDPDGTAITYAWTQTDSTGVSVSLSATDTKSVSFITTAAMEGKDFSFKVAITSGGNTVEATTTVTINNAEVIAQAVRKESKAASKILINRVSKTVMGRLSHLRKKQGKSSDFNGLSFTNGIKVQFANSEISTAINNVLGANGLNSTIKIPTRKLNRWDAWSSGKIVIGKSNGESNNKTRFKLKSLNVGVDRKLGQDKIIGFALGIGKENRTSTGADFSGDIDTTQWSLSSYGSLEIDKHTSLEGVIGAAKANHKVSSASDNQKSNGYFASIAYRSTLQTGNLDLSPYARYDISRVKMKATDVLTNSEASTDEALALGIDANHAIDYKDGKLNRFINLEYKSDLRRGNNDYISKNAEQEVIIKLGIDYQVKDTNIAVNYERVQSTNNKAHSNGIEGTLRWKF